MNARLCRPNSVEKGPSGAPLLATMALLSAPLATSHRWLHSFLPRAPGKAPWRHIDGCAGAWVQSGGLPRQVPCRGCCLAAPRLRSRQGPVSEKPPDATRQRPRQGACRGKPPLCARAPAHPPTCHSGTLPGVRGGRLCSQRCAVASGADKIAIVASGGVPDGPFCTV